jgi:hypothetical protein
MDAARIARFRANRDQLAILIQNIKDTPEDARPTKPSALKAWNRDLADNERLLADMDRMLLRVDPPPKPEPKPAPRQAEEEDASNVIAELGRIPKGKRAEMRVLVKRWKSRRTLDIRLWFLPEGGSEFAPSRKGVSIDASKVDALIEALHKAKQHV